MADSSLPVPPVWGKLPSTKNYVGVVVLAVLAVFVIATGIYGAINASFMSTFGAWYAAGLCLVSLVLGVHTLRIRKNKIAPRMRQGIDGRWALTFSYSRLHFGCVLAMTMLSGAVIFLSGLTLIWFGAPIVNGMSVPFTVFALFIWSLFGSVALGHFRLGRIEFSPDGVYQRGWNSEVFAPWSSIGTAGPSMDRAPMILMVLNGTQNWRRKQFVWIWRQDKWVKPATMVIPAPHLGVDPVGLLHLLGFYLQNPDSRAELGTARALERAREYELYSS